MKKNNIFLIVAIFIVVMVFCVAALCNQCSILPSVSTTVPDTKEGVNTSDSNSTSSDNDSETTGSKSSIENNKEGTTTDTDAETAEETTSETIQKTSPTIKLEIYEGPTYSAQDDICFYRVQAKVTGNPKPTVSFSKDDSNGAWGANKVQINIKRFSPYKLTATATNSAGTASDSINLAWGCGPENRNPEISGINIPGGTLYTNHQYDISVTASDPDGDALTYTWSVSGGSINNPATNPIKWTTPGSPGSYNLTVTVSDIRGGQITKTETVNIAQESINLSLHQVTSEGGYIEQNGAVNAGGCLYMGDSANNKPVRGFISYDITGLAGATIQDAVLTFNLKQKWSDPSALGALSLCSTYWGANPLIQAYFISSCKIGIQNGLNIGDGNITCNSAGLKAAIQDAINTGWPRLQITMWLPVPTNGNNVWDGWEYNQGDINLNITYNH